MAAYANPFDPDKLLWNGCPCGMHRSLLEHQMAMAGQTGSRSGRLRRSVLRRSAMSRHGEAEGEGLHRPQLLRSQLHPAAPPRRAYQRWRAEKQAARPLDPTRDGVEPDGSDMEASLARAMSIEPKIMLPDEPFSALDALTRGSLQDELLTVCRETDQTVFMITHDVEEALLLADKIVLMTNGPEAPISEIVVNTRPRGRTRHDMHRHAHYHPLRNHLIDFPVERATGRKDELLDRTDYDPTHPEAVAPGATGARPAPTGKEAETEDPAVMASRG